MPEKKNASEILDIVNEQGIITGKALRSECHGNPKLLHQVVHGHLFGTGGSLFLQKRSWRKDLFPGKWDTGAGGHVDSGEQIFCAMRSELSEELSINSAELIFLFSYLHRNSLESELVHSYKIISGETPRVCPEEIDEGRYWSRDEILAGMGKGIFTDNFEDEFRRLQLSGY